MNTKKYKGFSILIIFAILSVILYNPIDNDRHFTEIYAESFRHSHISDYTDDSGKYLEFTPETDETVNVFVDGPFNLKADDYQFLLAYTTNDDSSIIKIFATDYVSRDNSGGAVLYTAPLNQSETGHTASFNLDMDVDNVFISVETRDDSFELYEFELGSYNVIYSDSIIFSILIFIVGVFIFILVNLKKSPISAGEFNGDTIPSNKMLIAFVFIMGCGVLIASIPLMQQGLETGHDISFHLARITGIQRGLESGQFPVRVHGGTLNDYGYPNSLMYPELLLYFPAILSLLGMHVVNAYKLYIVFVNILTLVFAYIAFVKIINSRYIALSMSLIYLLNPYRLVCVYYRSAVGEYTALIFFPLVAYGLYSIIAKNKKDWWYLVIGATGVLQSHILSTQIVAYVCVFVVLFSIKSLFTKEKRILYLILAALFTLAINAWFIGPMLLTIIQWHLAVFTRTQSPSRFTIYNFERLFTTYSVDNFGPHPVGWVTFFILGAYILYRIIANKDKINPTLLKLGDTLSITSVVTIFATTKYFPWHYITQIPVIGQYIDAIQFPYRLLGITGVSTTILLGICVILYSKHKNARIAICFSVIVFSIFTTSLFYEENYGNENNAGFLTKHYYDSNLDNTLSIGQGEYIVGGADVDKMVGEPPVITSTNSTLEIENLERYGTVSSFDFTVDLSKDDENIIFMPITYIPNYTVTINGTQVESNKYDDAKVYFTLTEESGSIEVKYTTPLLYRLCELVSIASIGVFIYRDKLLDIYLKKIRKN